jgi:hypothetical protein
MFVAASIVGGAASDFFWVVPTSGGPFARVGITRQAAWRDALGNPEGEDVQSRKQKGVPNVVGSVGRKDVGVYRDQPGGRRQQASQDILGMEKVPDHAVLLITVGPVVVLACVAFLSERHLRYSGSRHKSFLRTKLVT